ncbi:MAG: GGDEF domain-containing protein [Oxalicibacterium faecigallinarum]|uniref:GGDEF domain-containing protein n=1 Tax=Oxalicibacterium faecigallinarum TaxID=573741 RepID=UPI002806CFE5|nr:GGDEF domain-containing protein [Oxalicibacterium faecigallinarum]MDQ7970363.1 GGDEF domain-containing protein [Oxalicibacterium faecigallinarum]
MDSLTAGIALILVQFCIALVMAGVYFTARTETCTRYWSLASCLIALGILVAIFNNRAFDPVAILFASATIVTGGILQWHGILAFYKQPASSIGWYILVIMLAAMATALFFKAVPQQRLFISTPLVTVVLILSLRTIWIGQGGWPRSFVQALAPAGIILLLINNCVRMVISGMQLTGHLSLDRSILEILAAFVVPTAGMLLFSIGLLLLYFERMVDENRHLATHDELSRLLNRRAIDAGGERELELALRLKRHLTVAFIDIDMFKRFNDEFGHASGDMVITDVAAILSETCRNIDLVGRYGGEEFLIVLPGVNQDDAMTVGQRLVEAVHRYRFLGVHPVTISVGLATLPDMTCSWDQLIRRADAALYEAKSLGRNRYCI